MWNVCMVWMNEYLAFFFFVVMIIGLVMVYHSLRILLVGGSLRALCLDSE